MTSSPQTRAKLTRSLGGSLMSSHSGLGKVNLPSMMARSMYICFRCQNGGHPTRLQRYNTQIVKATGTRIFDTFYNTQIVKATGTRIFDTFLIYQNALHLEMLLRLEFINFCSSNSSSRHDAYMSGSHFYS